MPWFWEGKRPPHSAEDFSPTRKFQLKEAAFRGLLFPGEEIDGGTWETLERPDIVFIGNSRLNPDCFSLRPADYQAIGSLVYPGKSATLDFVDIRERGMQLTKEDRQEFIRRTFGKDADRRDNLYIANLPDIWSVGYRVYYAPASGNGLHVRLVWGEHAGLQYPVMATLPEISTSHRSALAQVFSKAQVYT